MWSSLELFADLFDFVQWQEREDFQEAYSVGIHHIHPELVHFVWRRFICIEPDGVAF